MSHPSNSRPWQQWAADVAAFAFPALSVALPNGYSVAALFLLLVSLLALPQWWHRPVVPRSAWQLVLVFLCMAALWQLDGLRSAEGWRSTDKPMKFLLVLPCLFFLLRFPPRQAFLWAGIGGGAVATGLSALYQCFWRGLPRAEGSINAIQFGNLSLLLGLMSLVGLLLWRPRQRTRAWNALLALGTLMGLLGSLLSQSRGGWLALGVMVPVLAVLMWRFLSRRYFIIASIALVSAGVIVLSAAAYKFSDRIELVRQEAQLYENTGNAATSVGQRLAHWKLAWELGVRRPWIGWAQQGYEQEKKRYVAEGRVHPFVLQFNHAHNEYLDLFAKRGLLGLGVFLWLYLVPLSLFWPRRGVAVPPAQQGLRVTGVLIPVAYAGFGLTQGFLGHNSGTMFFLFMTVLIFGALQERSSRFIEAG